MTSIREARTSDFGRINAIYNWTIVDNHVSFDTTPFDPAACRAWWQARDPELSCLVGETDGTVVGVAYSSWYRAKPAYRSTMETTVVVDQDHLGAGAGTALLSALLDRITDQGVHRAIAIVALPNVASVALHHKLGYRTAGVLTEAGFKLGRYWDTMLLEKPLSA